MRIICTSEKKLQEDLVKKVYDLILESKVNPKRCPKCESCNYLVEQINAMNFNIPEANDYLELICGHYPDACELNSKNN